MTEKQFAHEQKKREWISLIQMQKASGMTIRAWCKDNGLKCHAFKYWQRIVKDEGIELNSGTVSCSASKTTVFAEMPKMSFRPAKIGGMIRILAGKAEMIIEQGTEPETIRAAVEAVMLSC